MCYGGDWNTGSLDKPTHSKTNGTDNPNETSVDKGASMKSKTEVCVYFGKRVRAIRSKRKLTQKDLADKVGVHLSFLGDIERGKKGCSIDVAYRIAQSLDVNIGQFFIDDEVPEEIMEFVMFVKENSDKTLSDIVKIVTRFR